MFPLESIQEIISTTFVSGIVIFLNFVGASIWNEIVFWVALTAFTVLDKVYVLAKPVSARTLPIVLPSPEPDILKSIGSNVVKIISLSVSDAISIPALNIPPSL